MEDYSLSALAKVLGRAKSGLHKLAKTGQIPRLSNGRFDLASVQKALAANVDPARRRSVHLNAKAPGERLEGEQQAAEVSPITTPEAAAEAVSLIRTILDEEGVKAGAVDYNSARTAELILRTRERAIRLEVESGVLVDAKTVHAAVFKYSREDRDALQNWPSRVAPLLAAELGINQVVLTLALEREVRAHLVERSTAKLRLKVPSE